MSLQKINKKIKEMGWISLTEEEKIKKAKDIWQKRNESGKWASLFENEENFVTWYLTQERVCYCCGIDEESVRKFFYENDEVHFKMTRGGRRGHMLELDKKDNFKSENGKLYDQDNCGLLCYPCNNAKSNICNDYESFLPIANGIKEFWINNRK